MREKIEFENDSFNEVTSKSKARKIIPKFILGIVFIIICIIIFIVILKRKNIDSMLYEAKISVYEIYSETKAYIINNETVVDYNKNSTIVTLATETKRIAVGDVIAMYKTQEYDKNKEKLNQLDERINAKLMMLPSTYSSEIVQVENEIDSVIKEIKNTSSYITINEYKSKLNDLAYKKAKILASLNPSFTDLLSLISERDAFKENMNTSLNNIKADISGVVIYNTDGLENKFSVDSFELSKIKEIKKTYDNLPDEVFGIKIVDNFESYIIIEENNLNNRIYMNEGLVYNLEVLSKDAILKGTLINIIDSEDKTKVYCVFRVTNGVENLVEDRTLDIKVIWKKYNGFFIDNTSITNKNNIDYVTILSLNEYIDIPVKKVATLEDKSLVVNYTNSELEENSIERERRLILYDRIVKDISVIKR